MIVIERYIDLAGKYRVVVSTDDNSRAFILKFQQEVKDEEAISEAQRLWDLEGSQQSEQEYLIRLIEEEKELLNELIDGSN